MVITSKYTRGQCSLCDVESLSLDPEHNACPSCRHAMRIDHHLAQYEEMRNLLNRLVAATSAGLRADGLEVTIIAQEARELLDGGR